MGHKFQKWKQVSNQRPEKRCIMLNKLDLNQTYTHQARFQENLQNLSQQDRVHAKCRRRYPQQDEIMVFRSMVSKIEL